MKAVAVPYQMRVSDGVYTLVVDLQVLYEDDTQLYTIYATSTSFNPLLPNWKARCMTAIATWAEDNEVDIDQVLFLPDFSLIGL